MLTWKEFEPHFQAAILALDESLGVAMNVCELFEGLMTEISKVVNNGRGIDFVLETQKHMQTLEGLNYVVDKENIPSDAFAYATGIILKTQFVMSALARLEKVLGPIPTQEKLPEGVVIH